MSTGTVDSVINYTDCANDTALCPEAFEETAALGMRIIQWSVISALAGLVFGFDTIISRGSTFVRTIDII